MTSGPRTWASRFRRRAGLGRGLLALPAALLVAGCGIQQTGVVGTGGPATLGSTPVDSGGRSFLVFLRSPDGRLTPVPRFYGGQAPLPAAASTRMALIQLLAGPLPVESAAGLGTSLPRPTDMSGFRVEVTERREARLVLPLSAAGLDRTALGQLSCTIAFAAHGTAGFTVRVSGRDRVTRTGTCDLGPRGAAGSTPGGRATVSPAQGHAAPGPPGRGTRLT